MNEKTINKNFRKEVGDAQLVSSRKAKIQDYINQNVDNRIKDVEGHAEVANKEMGQIVVKMSIFEEKLVNVEEWMKSLDAKIWIILCGVGSLLIAVILLLLQSHISVK